MTTNARPLPTRDRILSTAGRLFYQHGYRAIGVDRIIAEADVAKQSFYNHFPSKEDVMVAWIELAAGYGVAGEAEAIAGRADPMTAVVEGVLARAREASCRGCTFQVGAAEFAEAGHRVHAAAIAVKQATLARYTGYARTEGARDPERAARQIAVLVEGVWAMVRMHGPGAQFDGTLDLAKLALAS